MERVAVNPWDWSLGFGFNQGEVITGAALQLIVSGQTATDAQGAPQHPGDMRAQMALALENLEAVLAAAGMSLRDVVRLQMHTTDMDATLENYDVLAARLGAEGVAPPMTLVGVTRLAMPPAMVEIEATAMQ